MKTTVLFTDGIKASRSRSLSGSFTPLIKLGDVNPTRLFTVQDIKRNASRTDRKIFVVSFGTLDAQTFPQAIEKITGRKRYRTHSGGCWGQIPELD
jgi:hypothetical protein